MLVRIATLADRFDVEVEPFWALRRLDGMIRARLREKEDKEEEGNSGETVKIRLVYQGRLLSDLEASIGDAGLIEDCVVHCMVSKIPVAMQPATVVPQDNDRGFSALRTVGYSDDEIEVLRLTYFPRVVEFARERSLDPREDPHDRWSRL